VRAAPSSLLCLLLSQCAGTAPAPKLDAERVEAFYEGDGTVLGLRNASSLAPEYAYNSGRTPNLKVARDEDMARLIAAFRQAGYFAAANPGPAAGAHASLTLVVDGARSVLSRLPLSAATIENNRLFNDCLQSYRYVYDNTVSFHTGSNVGIDELSRQNEKVRREVREALDKHQGRR